MHPNRYSNLKVLALLLALTHSTVDAQDAPQVFAEGIIVTGGDEYGPTFSPDGMTLYFTSREKRSELEHIVSSTHTNNGWSEPAVTAFSGGGLDKEPYLSPDGQRLFFASTRTVGGEDLDFEIWYVDKQDDGTWSEAVHLAAVGSPMYENYPAVAANGNLYFSSKRDSESNDLWVARFEDGEYLTPKAIDELNTPASDADPYIDPDERFMIFSSTRPGGMGGGDLYVSYNREGAWTEPENLGPVVNSDDYEYTPMRSHDGQTFYFSRGWGTILHVDWEVLGVD